MNDADKELILSLKVGPCRFPKAECWDSGPICYCKAMDEAAERIAELSDANDKLTKNNRRYHNVAHGYASALGKYAELLEECVIDLRRVLEKMERIYSGE